MKMRIDRSLALEVMFHPSFREEGFEDDIRFAMQQSGPKEFWLFPADAISVLLTPRQAERLGRALLQAAKDSRNTP